MTADSNKREIEAQVSKWLTGDRDGKRAIRASQQKARCTPSQNHGDSNFQDENDAGDEDEDC